MKIAVIGSPGVTVSNLDKYLPPAAMEIVVNGEHDADQSAREHAAAHDLKVTEFLPEYEKYADLAIQKRNVAMVEYADLVLAFWDGQDRGIKNVMDYCNKTKMSIRVFV